MLGSDLQLSRNIVLYHLSEKAVVAIRHEVIEPYTRADKYLFYTGNTLNGFDQVHIFAVIHAKILAGCRNKAFSRRAYPVLELFFAGGVPEVRSRSAHIVNISLEIGERSQELCLGNNALLASRAHRPSLMEGESAEVTASETAPVVCKREFHLGDRGHTALLFI